MSPLHLIAVFHVLVLAAATWQLGPVVLLLALALNALSVLAEVAYTPSEELDTELARGITRLAIVPGLHFTLHLPVYVFWLLWVVVYGVWKVTGWAPKSAFVYFDQDGE